MRRAPQGFCVVKNVLIVSDNVSKYVQSLALPSLACSPSPSSLSACSLSSNPLAQRRMRARPTHRRPPPSSLPRRRLCSKKVKVVRQILMQLVPPNVREDGRRQQHMFTFDLNVAIFAHVGGPQAWRVLLAAIGHAFGQQGAPTTTMQ